MVTADAFDILVKHTLFRDLAPDLVQRIAQLGEPRHLDQGEVLFRLGDEGDALYGVLCGRVRIAVTNAMVGDLEITVMEPGDIFGEISLIDGLPRTADAIALEPTGLVGIPHTGFIELLNREPNLTRHLLGLLGARIRSSTENIALRRQAEQAMKAARDTAERALADLKATQEQLVQAEKMASLGGLVAGVAHEINTPLGICVTTASHLADQTTALGEHAAAGKLRRSDLDDFLVQAGELLRLLTGNLGRAAELVHCFKQIAADQTSDERRRFDLRGYIDEVLMSLQHSLRQTPHHVSLFCPEGLELDGYPGALSQILTELFRNALAHAFTNGKAGRITITVTEPSAGEVELRFADDGSGIPKSVRAKVFDPFFTTRRGAGARGLGLHIVYNTVTSTWRGSITVDSEPGRGSAFVLRLPRVVPADAALV